MKTTFNTPEGVCRFCGCSEYDACEEGCWWVDATRRLCSTCVPASKAEGRALRTLRGAGYRYAPDFLRAFHAGFRVGWFAVSARSPYGRNPHGGARAFEAWNLGQRHGQAARVQFERACGPITAVPRRAVLMGHAGTARARRIVAGRGHGARDRRAWGRA